MNTSKPRRVVHLIGVHVGIVTGRRGGLTVVRFGDGDVARTRHVLSRVDGLRPGRVVVVEQWRMVKGHDQFVIVAADTTDPEARAG